jgi:hypothetical protein
MVADVDRLADDMVAAANRTKMLLNEAEDIRLPYNRSRPAERSPEQPAIKYLNLVI